MLCSVSHSWSATNLSWLSVQNLSTQKTQSTRCMKLCWKNKNRWTTLDVISLWICRCHSNITGTSHKNVHRSGFNTLCQLPRSTKRKNNVIWVLVSCTINHMYNVHSTETELLFGFYFTYSEMFYKMVTNLQSSLCLLADIFVKGIQWVKYQKSSSFGWSTQNLWSSWCKLGFPATHQNQKDHYFQWSLSPWRWLWKSSKFCWEQTFKSLRKLVQNIANFKPSF